MNIIEQRVGFQFNPPAPLFAGIENRPLNPCFMQVIHDEGAPVEEAPGDEGAPRALSLLERVRIFLSRGNNLLILVGAFLSVLLMIGGAFLWLIEPSSGKTVVVAGAGFLLLAITRLKWKKSPEEQGDRPAANPENDLREGG